jgi:hypothetical protein
MADDRKRTENLCTKVTERMAVDLNRELARLDVKLSSWLYVLIRRELYGVTRQDEVSDGD